MGYDTRPLLSLDEKTLFLEKALLENAFLLLEHDPHHELISLQKTDKGIRLKEHFNFDYYFNS